MRCPECREDLIVFSNLTGLENYARMYFCTNCQSNFEITSDSGDFIEEYLDYIGKI